MQCRPGAQGEPVTRTRGDWDLSGLWGLIPLSPATGPTAESPTSIHGCDLTRGASRTMICH